MPEGKTGFIFVDKPADVTSFFCVNALRSVTGIRRIGFLGTLDPLATGLMIFAIGESTKMISYLEKMDKVYDVTIRLGVSSDTFDIRGNLQERDVKTPPDKSQIVRLLREEFTGEITQVPPVHSAVWVNGKRAYALARTGAKLEMKPRKVIFHDIQVKEYDWPHLRLSVHCSSGTYIRSLANDIGERLSVSGLVEELRRTKIGQYGLENATSLTKITPMNVDSLIIPPEIFFADWHQIELTDEQFGILISGGFIENKERIKSGPLLAIFRGTVCAVLELWKGNTLKIKKRLNVI